MLSDEGKPMSETLDRNAAFRAVPAVQELLEPEAARLLLARFGRVPLLAALRRDLDDAREAIKREALAAEAVAKRWAPAAILERAGLALERDSRRTYVRVLNATGVILHTGLGRAPLAHDVREAVLDSLEGAQIVEVDRTTGERNERESRISDLVREIAGAPAATVVNNNAGATLIALAALAAGRGVVVSRGQLVEIGGSYRIPDVMEQSGARLVEVGTTNKTHPKDYEKALDDPRNEIALVLRVHTSNFKVVGFAEEVSLADLAAIAKKRGVPLMDDLGSGSFVDLAPHGLPGEPLVQESVRAGAAVATFSGDKLLGGPQAGLLVGEKATIERIRKHPLFRALRPGRLTLAALEATLLLYRDPAVALARVPVLRMISLPLESVLARAKALHALAASHPAAWTATVREDESMVGGGSYATQRIPTHVVALEPRRESADSLARRLRLSEPSVFARIQDGRVLLDPRTLDPSEDALLGRVLSALAASPSGRGDPT